MKVNFRIFFRNYRFKLLLLLVATSILVPYLSIALLLIIGVFALIVSLLQLSSTFQLKNHNNKRGAFVSSFNKEPFVSIHLATHNEPPKIVKKALDALAAINYSNFEVLVVDNNTSDPKLWKPLQEHCENLGSKFHFIHVENLMGFKSGALNLALKHMSPNAEILALVDADYIVEKDFLKKSVVYFQDPKIALVQFPQDYLNTTHGNVGMGIEYRSFFSSLMSKAHELNAVTVTGTMGLLRANLFRNDFRWNEWCITEDTELGIHLHRQGYRGVYLNETSGQGLMPLDYYSLQRQRQRWTFGNMQVILKNFWPIFSNPDLTWQQKRSFLAQLTAWFHPNLLPIIILAPGLLFVPFIANTAVVVSLALAITILWLFFLAKLLYFARSFHPFTPFTIKNLMLTTFAHYGLSSVMSKAWIQALLKNPLAYNRTNKDPEETAPQPIPQEIIWACLLVFSAIVSLVKSPLLSVKIIAVLTVLFALFLLLAITSLQRQLSVTKKFTKQTVQAW